MHVAVKQRYERLVKGNQRALTNRYGVTINRWQDLYKADATILQRFSSNLTRLRQGLVANNIVVAGPEDLDFVTYPTALPFRDELIDRMVGYGLDTSDTVILLEAERLGLDAIETMDRDMGRAVVDFDIFTWI